MHTILIPTQIHSRVTPVSAYFTHMGRFHRSRIEGQCYGFTLVALEEDDEDVDAIRLTQEQLSAAIPLLVRTGQIRKLDALLQSFGEAWLKRRSALPEDAPGKAKGYVRGMFTRVVNKIVEAMLTYGLFLTITPKEVGALLDDLRHFTTLTEEREFATALDAVIVILYATINAPRLNVEAIVRYAEAVARPEHWPNMSLRPKRGALNDYLLEQLLPQRVALAEQTSAKALPLVLHEAQPEYSVQLAWLYPLVRTFDKAAVRRLAYATSILHRISAWHDRLVPGEKNPPTVSEPRGFVQLPFAAQLVELGILDDAGARPLVTPPEHKASTVRIFGHHADEIEAALAAARPPTAAAGAAADSKRKRA